MSFTLLADLLDHGAIVSDASTNGRSVDGVIVLLQLNDCTLLHAGRGLARASRRVLRVRRGHTLGRTVHHTVGPRDQREEPGGNTGVLGETRASFCIAFVYFSYSHKCSIIVLFVINVRRVIVDQE